MTGRKGRDIKIRHELTDIDKIKNALLLDRRAGKCAHRNRHFINALLTFLGGNSDFFENKLFVVVLRHRCLPEATGRKARLAAVISVLFMIAP